MGFSLCWNACRFYAEHFGNDTYTLDTHISWSFRCYFFGDTFPSGTSFRRGHRPNFLGNGFPGFDGVKVPGILKVVWDARYSMGPPYSERVNLSLYSTYRTTTTYFSTTLWQTYSYLNFLTATLHNYWLGTFCSLFLVPHVAFSEVCTMPQRSLCVMKLRRMKCRLETQLAFAFFPKQSVFTPPKFNMELERSPQKRKFLLETIIFRFHVKFRGSTLRIIPFTKWFGSPPFISIPPVWKANNPILKGDLEKPWAN